MNNLTPEFNQKTFDHVKSLIDKKCSSQPFIANNNSILNVTTDMDHHPYNRWFRGVYYYPNPIVMEREAGFRPRQDDCYKIIYPSEKVQNPEHDFHIPCNTIIPKNGSCVVQYR